MKILIVDGNKKFNELLHLFLPTNVDEVIHCSDSDTAYKIYLQIQPDWVVINWHLSESNGITATGKIKSSDPGARICVVSTHNQIGMRDLALETGAAEFIPQEELKRLRQLLSEH